MRADLGRIYDETITVVNRLDARDAGEQYDRYRATVLTGCMWSATATRSVQSDGSVVVGTVHRVQIPENDAFLPYREWSALADQAGRFTVRQGDYIVRGEVAEEIDAANVRRVIAAYEPDAFQVQHFRDLTKGEGFDHGTDGALRFAECYYVEG